MITYSTSITKDSKNALDNP